MEGQQRGASAQFIPVAVGNYNTGVLAMVVAGRAVLSVPSQLGCAVACSFCLSRETPLIRNLTAEEMLMLVHAGLAALPGHDMPIELSFTGEGEPALNWKQAALVCRELPAVDRRFSSVRYCFSGLGAHRLLGLLDGGPFPVRLQLSLHAAREHVRQSLVPNSLPLQAIEAALMANAHRFTTIELNVVLQDGVNDSDDDLAALGEFGDSAWPILLNPLLTRTGAKVAAATDRFESALRTRGRTVKRYGALADRISAANIYPRLTAVPVVLAR